MEDLRETWSECGLTESAINCLLNSWAPSTRKQYDSALKTFHKHCQKLDINPWIPNIPTLLNYLASMSEQGKSFSSIGTSRAAVIAVWEQLSGSNNLGESAMLKRFMKGIFRSKPPTPKYADVWDVEVVLSKMRDMPNTEELPLGRLTHKLVTLLAICSPQRVSEIASLSLTHMQRKHDSISFVLPMSKNRGMGPAHTVMYQKFDSEPNLCPVATIERYLKLTEQRRNQTDEMILATREPYNKVSPSTISRWVREFLKEAGIDSKFGAHSTRSAATSKAASAGISLKAIMQSANWAPKSSIFQQFYNKPIRETVQDAVLRFTLMFTFEVAILNIFL